MSRVVLRLVLDVVGTIAVALVILALFFTLLGGGIGESVRVLFNFMDVGLAIWLILLIVFAVRRSLTARRTYVLLAIGAVVNLLVVVTVGFVQGGWAPVLVLFAFEAGIACLLAAAIVVPLVHRLVKPPITSGAPT
ncbi:MAG: hypothetical protein ABI566_11875 [Pseudolysinimonas sp.]